MVFNLGEEIYSIAFLFLFLWATLLSFFVYQAGSHYRRLTKGVARGDLKTVLEKILGKIEVSEEKIEEILKRTQGLEKEGLTHIKKIGVLRFNPFRDTGGNQSFILALLDEEDSGLVLSSLYTREGNRWYAKKVEKGKGLEHDLSKEEEEAIKKAKS